MSEIDNTTKKHPYEIGKCYLIRTVTQIDIGRLVAVYDQELVLEQASWISDTGRYHNALKNGVSELKEVEPYINNVIIGRGSIVDATIWHNELPKAQK